MTRRLLHCLHNFAWARAFISLFCLSSLVACLDEPIEKNLRDPNAIEELAPILKQQITATPDVSASLSSVTADMEHLVADGEAVVHITVVLRDSNNDVLADHPVSLRSSRGIVDTIAPAETTTDVNGSAIFTVSSLTTGSATFSALDMVDETKLIQTVTTEFKAALPSTSASSVTASTNSYTIGSATALTVSVILKDARGNLISGKTLALTSDRGATDTITPTSIESGADGSAVFTVTSNTSGAAVFTVTDTTDDLVLDEKPSITFVDGAVSPSLSTVTSSSASLVADDSTTATVTVTLNIAAGPVAGKTVTLASSRGGNDTITPASGVSDASGIVTFTVKSAIAGNSTYTATDTTDSIVVTQTAAVTYVPGPVSAAQSTVARSSANIVANGSSTATITVTLKDAQNNAISGKTVSLSSSRGGSDSISAASGLSSASGVVTFTASSTTVGSATFTAVGDGVTITQTASVSFTVGPVTAAQSTVSTSAASVIADGTTATITVTLKDAQSHLISGKTVTLSSSRTSTDTISAASGASDGSGVVTFTVSSHTAGSATFTAVGDGVTITQTAAITFTAGAVTAAQSTVATSAASVVANGSTTATITVTLKDAYNNAVSGRTVTLSSSRGGTDSISAASGTSTSGGVVTFTVSSTTAGSATFTAVGDGVTITQTAAVSFIAGAVTAAQSTVATSAATVVADGTTTATITVTLKDANSNPVAGKTVTLSSSRTSTDTISAASGTSTSGGVVTFTVKSTTAGSATFTAVGDSITITQTAAVSFTADVVTAAQSTVARSAATVVANGSTTATITVTLKDAHNNAVSGGTVTLSSSRGGTDSISAASGTSTSGGVVTFTVSSTTAGSATFTAVGDGVTITQTAAVSFVAGPVTAAQSTVAAGSASILADGSATSTITVTLKDAQGNAVSGKTVTLASSRNSTDSISAASGTSTSGGVVTFTVSSTTVGTGTFTATGDSVTITQTAAVAFTVGAFSAANSTVATSSAAIVADGVATATITVTLKDAYGHGISGKTVTLASSRGGTDTISAASGASSGSGVVTFTISSSTLGGATFTATNVTDSNTVVTQTVGITFSSYLITFPYRQTLTINLASGANTPTGYQVLVHFDQGSVGPGFNWANQCGDLRFTATDGTEFSHWVESCTTSGAAAAKIWVKIPTAISTSGMTMYMYYGNTGYGDTSDGATTFDVFDNFNAVSLDAMWTSIASTNGTIGLSSGSLNLNCSNTCDWWNFNSDGVRVWQAFSGDYVFQTVLTDSVNDSHSIGLFIGDDPTISDAAVRFIALEKNFNIHNVSAERLGQIYANPLSVAGRYFLRIRYSTTVYFEYSKDGIQWYEVYNEATTGSKIGLMAKTWSGASVSTAFEYFFARKFNAVEPTVTMGTTTGYTAPTLTAWGYKMPVTVSLASGSASPAGYQVLLKLNAGNVGAHFNWGLACTDLRFRDSLNAELSYWIESCAASTARIWIKMNSAITTTGEQIMMFYSNGAATIVSDGWRTFESFDDFESASLHTNYWGSAKLSGTFTQTGGALVASCTADCDWYAAAPAYNDGLRIWRPYSGQVVIQTAVSTSISAGALQAGLFVSDLPLGHAGDNHIFVYSESLGQYQINDVDIINGSTLTWTSVSSGKYYLRARATNSTMYFDYSTDADTWTSNFANFSGTKSYFGLMLKSWNSSSNAQANFDYVFVRKYHTLEPSVAFGSEVTN